MNTNEIVPTTWRINDGFSTTLIDVNVDCLLKIFRFLSLGSLASVAEVCHLFQDVAVQAFTYEWKNRTIRLSNKCKNSKLESTAILRYFGTQMQKAIIVFDKHGNDTFFNMIINKCSLQLIQVDFSSTCFNVKLKKVLSKSNICRFNAKFRNLKRLRFANNADDITAPECIEQTFPALKELSLFGYPFKKRNVDHFLKWNHQIEHLALFNCNSVQDAKKLLKTIDQKLPQLKELGLLVHGNAGEIEYQPRLLKNLRRLKLHNYGSASNLQHLSISNERVEEMELELGFCDEILINFVCQYKELNKLAIRLYGDSLFDCNFLKKLCEHLPKLAEIEIGGFWENLNHTDVTQFIGGCKCLDKFILRDTQREDLLADMEIIQRNLDSTRWTVAYNSSPRWLNFERLYLN